MQKVTQPLEQWVGRTQTVTDVISSVQVRQMAATLNDASRMKQPELATLPVGWHWLYFNPMEVQSQLGDDGHPLRGDFLPPVQLPRRMWAGSRLMWTRAFNVGDTVEKKSEILKVARKTGRSGEMVFVTVAHRYSDAQGLLLNEEHDIVYCENPADVKKAPIVNVAAKIQATCDFPVLVFERKGEHTKPVHADSIMLYRYSAATFNGHRIHYDVDYCRDVEGYPGLVVHGPLIATLLLGYVENEIADGRSIKTFEFRANRPTFDTSDFHLHASKTEENNTWQVWSTNNMGQIGIDGRMTLE